jgi:TadE-like protein
VRLSKFNKYRRHQPAVAGQANDQEMPADAGREEAADLPQQPRRGQSLVEVALVLPLLVLFLTVVLEAGLAINASIRVNTAARDGTRFALDQARVNDVGSLVLTKLSGIDFGSSKEISGSGNIDIYEISGLTDASGNIPSGNTTYWKVTHIYDGDNSGGSPTVTSTVVSARIKQQSGSDPANIPFVIVEVDFKYTPLFGTLIAPGAKLPMSSYAIIQQQPNN